MTPSDFGPFAYDDLTLRSPEVSARIQARILDAIRREPRFGQFLHQRDWLNGPTGADHHFMRLLGIRLD